MFRKNTNETHWMHVSDLMSGLMIIFLLISICYRMQLEDKDGLARENADLKSQLAALHAIVQEYDNSKKKLHKALYKEFKDDLQKWSADINPDTLSITFNNPETLFANGESTVSPRYKEILNDFFPRYIGILFSSEFKPQIQEIRIEGHTSSKWKDVSPDNAYFLNMELSQDRTRAVLDYCFNLPILRNRPDQQAFIKDSVTANGLSSSKLKRTPEGGEDEERSRRVEFRTITRAEEKIQAIIRKLEEKK